MFEQFTAAARATVVAAREEAVQQGARTIGTEHLLLGVLREGGPRVSAALGLDAADCRAGLERLDTEALASVGVDPGDFGDLTRRLPGRQVRHLPLTAGSKAVLTGTLREARAAKQRSLRPEHLLLALLGRERPDPVAELLTRLDVDRAAVRERLSA